MSSPFDDPEFREQMARMGVVHQPGMAADLLAQISPLLAAQGVDMDDLDGKDLDSVNAALARATAQHNFMLFSPIGAHREGALSLLRDVALAVARDEQERAASLLSTIQPDPSGDAPSVAHVIGAGLGLLDTWHADPALRGRLGRTRVPRWHNGRSRKAGTDIIGLAKKARAFDSIDGLHRNHSGFSVFEGAALAVAGSVISWAQSEGVDLEVLVDKVISTKSYQAPSGSAFRRPAAKATVPNANLQGRFRTWLEDAAPNIGAPTVDEEAQLFDGLTRMADILSLDIGTIEGSAALLDEFFESADDFPLDAALLTLYDYARFQVDNSNAPDEWDALSVEIENEIDGSSPLLEAVQDAVAREAEIPEAELRSSVEQTRIVRAVGPLLEWIGTGRAVTSTGNVRRVDIEQLAALLGIAAIGVGRSPALDDAAFERMLAGEDPAVFEAKSLSDVPIVAEWWEALRLCDVLDITASRVRPGPAASAWIDGSVTLSDLQMLVSVFVSEVISRTNHGDHYGVARAASVMRELHRAISPEEFDDADQAEAMDDPLFDALRTNARRTLTRFARLGIGEADADGTLSLPRGLHATVAKGMTISMAVFRATFEE